MDYGSQTFLLVEDEPGDVFLMRRALSKAKIASQLQVVTDGRMAVDYLSGSGKFSDRAQYPLPSLILLDLKIPYVHGFEVLRWIKAQPELSGVLVVVLTSSTEERDVQRAYALGACSFLVKPPTAQMLQELLKSFESCWGRASAQSKLALDSNLETA